ncbi:choice-of-anchor A family protein [Streptoverticillium reticulum]|uniref:choice-of-anchor A family protein n=1 Tax=Streptoverticillium reticulum TaxID=1433415 RepID=UPI0039BF0024
MRERRHRRHQHPHPHRKKPRHPAATVLAAGIVTGGALLLSAVGVPGVAEPLPAGLGPCMSGSCPGVFPEPAAGPARGRDNAVNVFVGGDFHVRRAAAEAEGSVVVLGSFDVAEREGASQAYQVGAATLGSHVPPDNGSAFLRVGGDVRVAGGRKLLAEDGTVNGTVAYAGTQTGTVSPRAVHDASAVDRYRHLRDVLTSASSCYAYDKGVPRKPTGTAVNYGQVTVFTGDGASPLQVFDVGFDLVAPDGGAQAVEFRNVPQDATVLVNFTGDSRMVSPSETGVTGARRERLLWNFPDASEVRLTGSGNLHGSVLVGRPASTTVVTLSALNGRLFTAGSLSHESGVSGGQGIHAYPFDGELPNCEAAGALAAGAPRGDSSIRPAASPSVVAGDHELAHGGPPMGMSMAIGGTCVAAGAALALYVLYRSRFPARKGR